MALCYEYYFKFNSINAWITAATKHIGEEFIITQQDVVWITQLQMHNLTRG